MRFCAQELNKTVRLKDGDIGKVTDFVCEADEFFIRQINVRAGVWPFAKDYALPPYLANFLKSDSDHLFLDLTESEFKSNFQQASERTPIRADSVALEQQWGTPYTWEREGTIAGVSSRQGPVSSFEADYEDHPSSNTIPLFSCLEICDAELLIGEETIGQVSDIIFEPALMQARYLVIDEFESSSRSAALLLPLEWVSDWSLEEGQLRLSGFTKLDLYSAPSFEREDVINKEYEDQLCVHYGRSLSWRDRPRLPRHNRSTTLQP